MSGGTAGKSTYRAVLHIYFLYTSKRSFSEAASFPGSSEDIPRLSPHPPRPLQKGKLGHDVTVRIHNMRASKVDRTARGCLVAADNITCLRKGRSLGQFYPVRSIFLHLSCIQDCGCRWIKMTSAPSFAAKMALVICQRSSQTNIPPCSFELQRPS